MSAFIAALQFLTPFPWPRRAERSAGEIARGAVFFPLIGLILGGFLALADGLLKSHFPPMLIAVTLVALLALLSRGFHLDGLADTFDGLGAGGTREHVLAVMDDSRTGVFGVLAVVFVILFKVYAIGALGPARPAVLLFAPMLGRWATVLLAYRSSAAKEGLGAYMIMHMSPVRLLVATLTTFIVAAGFTDLSGLAVMGLVAMLTLALKYYCHRRLGGVTGDIFGAVEELSETSAFVLFALALG